MLLCSTLKYCLEVSNNLILNVSCTVEPLFNENLGITNGILFPSNNKMYEKEPRYNEPSI